MMNDLLLAMNAVFWVGFVSGALVCFAGLYLVASVISLRKERMSNQ